ncbi:MAG: class I SAM-dependent methyltransferase [bacterium LCO1.1]|uniref:Class I SAM-dependent methyltransferase n=1 Tax=Candidatus Weimeria bifida TaxID=2599074 RepID=A0A6N7J0W3_9FIRM|nr:class I SAM-dependent methyltransferase [Candidatus Weimeria bifida]
MIKKDDTDKYDYIICIGVLEYCHVPEKLLKILADYLKKDGIFLLGTDNRCVLRYFCGDRDKFTGCNFDSIEDYYRVDENEFPQMDGRCYSNEEIKRMTDGAGLVCRHCYSVYPSIEALN